MTSALMAVVVGLGLLACTRDPIDEERAKNAPPSDRVLMENAEYAVQQALRDPGSAEFRNVVVVHQDSLTAVCGEVNAKNGFGGYSGFTSFVAIGSVVQVQTRRDDGFATLWNAACIRPRGRWDPVRPNGNGDPVPP